MDNRIVSIDIVDGELIVTFQDGSTQSLGPVGEMDLEQLTAAVVKNAGDIVGLKRAVSALQTGVAAAETAIEGLQDDTDSLENEIGAIKNDLSEKADKSEALSAYIVETETGSIASFSDGADGVPVKDLSVAIEPVQDLHGQSSPYPAGGGANQFDALAWGTLEPNHRYYTVSADETITIIDDDTGGIGTRLIDIDAGEEYSFLTTFSTALRIFTSDLETIIQRTSGTFTAPADGKIAVKFYAQTYPTSGKFILVKGSTVPSSWSPYSNICPISGWTGANVTRTGKNLVDYSDNVRNQMSYAGGVISNSTTDDRTSAYLNIALLKNNTQVSRLVQSSVIPVGVFSQTFTVDNEFDHIRIWHSGSRVDFICTIPLSLPNGTYTLSIDFTGVNPSVVGGFAYKDIQVEAGSTVTAYEPYQGETYEVDWTTEAGTVYGGTLDVTTGVLTVDRASVVLDGSSTVTWAYQRTNGDYYTTIELSGMKSYANSEVANIVSSVFGKNTASADTVYASTTFYGFYGNNTAGRIRLCLPGVSTTQEFSAWLAEYQPQVVYELATPQTYQLTPQEVKTVLGQNNIFADTGDVTVEYRADTKLYIDKVISA